MIEYKQINGKQYEISNPKIINDNDNFCFLVNGTYIPYEHGTITYDYNLNKYVLKSSINVENGIVSIDCFDNPILGSWSWDKDHIMDETVVANYKDQSFYCISDKIFENTAWEEKLSDGIFYLKSSIPVKEFCKIKEVPHDLKNSYPYNSSDSIKEFDKIYKKKYIKESFNKGISNYPQVLGKYTYGFEFETSKGFIPSRIYNKLGLMPLRDGSIEGIEYATIPLESKKGLQTIIDTCEELEKRTIFNKDCSLHIHIGGMPRKESYFISLAKVLCHVQDEMYDMFPFYTRGGFGLKKKDYTAPLPSTDLLSKIDNEIDLKDKEKINKNFQHVFEFLSMGHNFNDYDCDLKKVISHPSDPNGTSKWYVKSRYRWVNMIPLLFGNKKTIEFRIHTPTYDHNKVIYFSIICAAIVDFAERSKKEILNGSFNSYRLHEILYAYLSQFGEKYNQVYDYILRYIIERKKYTKNCILQKDFFGNEDNFKCKFNIYESKKNNYGIISKKIIKDIELSSGTVFNVGSNHLESLRTLARNYDPTISGGWLRSTTTPTGGSENPGIPRRRNPRRMLETLDTISLTMSNNDTIEEDNDNSF